MAQQRKDGQAGADTPLEPLSDEAWRAQNDPAGVADVVAEAAQTAPAHSAGVGRHARAAGEGAKGPGQAAQGARAHVARSAQVQPQTQPQAQPQTQRQAQAQPQAQTPYRPAAHDPFADTNAPEPPPYQPVTGRASSDHTVLRSVSWEGSFKRANHRASAAASEYGSSNAAQTQAGSSRRVFSRKNKRKAASSAAPVASDGGNGNGGGGSSNRFHHRAHRTPKRAKHGCLSMLVWLVFFACVVVMALRCVPADLAAGRAIPEIVSIVPLLFIPLIICLVLAFLWRRRILLVLSVVALGIMVWWHAGYFLPSSGVSATAEAAVSTSASTDDSAARIMTLNTCNGGASAEEIVQLVREENVEILCLQELSDNFASELSAAGIDELLPYHVISEQASSVNNGGRNGIWTLAPMSNISENLLPIETSSMPAATIQIGSASVRVVSVHPNSPVRGAQDLWEAGLSTIGSLSDYDHTYLIMGDFNSTWDHARFRELLGTSFVDAGETAGGRVAALPAARPVQRCPWPAQRCPRPL